MGTATLFAVFLFLFSHVGGSDPQPPDPFTQCIELMSTVQYLQAAISQKFFVKGGYPKTEGAVWPQPQEQQSFNTCLSITPLTFTFKVTKNNCQFINTAIARYNFLIFKTRNADSYNIWPSNDCAGSLNSLEIVLENPCDNGLPALDMDEKYTLKINTADYPNRAVLSASSRWGILRGLETFSQLVLYKNGKFYVNSTAITDWPRFPYRGLLLDTSRHYICVQNIKILLATMSWAKLNVFHWHMVDSQSFPYESQLFPNMSKEGAYDCKTHIYTQQDIKDIVNYASSLGIRVVPEFDTPGHTQSWLGAPGLLTQCYTNGTNNTLVPNGFGPIDPSKEANFKFLENLFKEVATLFPDKFFHLGGDEVTQDCWASNPDIQTFMSEKGFGTDYNKLEAYFVERVQDIASSMGKTCIVWDDTASVGTKLKNTTIVEVWQQPFSDRVINATSQGNRVIVAAPWYLNYETFGPDWPLYYVQDPIPQNITPEQVPLILGGEMSIWTDFIDDTKLFPVLWPRGCAPAETFWSSATQKNFVAAAPRFEENRCRLVKRGIKASPQNGASYCEDDQNVCINCLSTESIIEKFLTL